VTFSNVQTGLSFSAGAMVGQGQSGVWMCDFGGACEPNTSTEATPYVTPVAPGTYQGHVIVNNAAGSDRFDFEVTVSDPAAPELDSVFNTDLTTGILTTLSVWNTGGGATSYSWTLPAGIDSPNPTQPYPSVTGLAAGTYDCSVTASNVSGSDTLEFVLTVEDMLPPPIDQVWPANLVSGQSTSFIASTNCNFPMTWTWDFGGGVTPNTSTVQFPNVSAGAPGTYNGVVTATNAGGTTTFQFTYTIQSN
jgi:PKD repeat protein